MPLKSAEADKSTGRPSEKLSPDVKTAHRVVPVDTNDWLTIREAMEHVHVSRRTIYNWLAGGRIVTRRTVSGTLRVSKASLWAPNHSNQETV